jgi:hypothetical protein
MNLFDPNFLTFDGNPIPGRGPVRVEVEGDAALTSEQQAGTSAAYKLFCDAKRLSLIDFHSQQYELDDGTRISMVSINGADQVHIAPPPPRVATALEDIFIAVPSFFGGHDTAAPNYSKQTPYRGKTAAPTHMRATREIVDVEGIREHPGNLTWWSDAIKVNGKPLIVSWYGKATRYGRADYYGRGRQRASTVMQDFLYGKEDSDARLHWDDAFKPRVWTNGVWHAVQKIVMGSPVDVPVMSAGLKKETDGMYLWLVSFDGTQLAVYKGRINPYRQKTVTVEWQFDIDFQVVTTPFSSSHPWWEAPLQPFYFNASCTKCAGLVAVNADTATNTSAAAVVTPTTGFRYCVAVAEVDLVAMTTTFSANHLTDEATTSGSNTGSATDWHGYSLASPPPIGTTDTFTGGGTNTYTVTEKKQRYGGVDYVGDQLTIAIAEMALAWDYVDTGTYTYSITNYLAAGDTRSGSLSRDVSKSVTASYRVFQYHDGHTLASFTGSTVALGSVHVESTSLADTGTGTSAFIVSDDVLLDVTVEGGDLRHKAVIVSELLDVGSSDVEETFAAAPAVGVWSADKFVAFDSAVADTTLAHSYSSSTRGRRPARRLVVWKDGTAIETGTWRNVYGVSPTVMASNNVPLLFYGAFDLGTNELYPNWSPIVTGSSTPAGSDYLLDWQDFATALAGYRLAAAMQGGIPNVNTCAFATDADDSQWFYNIAEYAFDATESPATFNPKAGFVIAGTKYDAHCENFYLGDGVSSYTDAVLASPIYLDNVPT